MILKINILKVSFCLFCIATAFMLILISVFSINNTKAAENEEHLVETINISIVPSMPESTPSTESSPEYELPESKILPDNPFYWVLMIKDRIKLWMTTRPALKYSLLLQYANNRLYSGEKLISEGKKALGITTITKAEKYMQKAGEVLQSQDSRSEVEEYKKALQKHKMVLEKIQPELSGTNLKAWSESWELNQKLQQAL